VEGSNKQKIYIYYKKRRKKNTFINPPFVKRENNVKKKRNNQHSHTPYVHKERENPHIKKGSLRVKEDAHSCQPEKKLYKKKEKKNNKRNTQKKRFFFFGCFFSQLTKSRRYSTESN
jgi:hypothetical protein